MTKVDVAFTTRLAPPASPRVLLIASECNPEWVSTPLIGWSLTRAIRVLVDGHLVTHVRNRDKIELWNGNVEPGWLKSLHWLIWPALERAFANRRDFPQRYAHLRVHRLRSDADVRAFVQSIAVEPKG